MSVITYVENLNELQTAHQLKIKDVILGHKDFSRFGTLDDNELNQLAKEANELGLNPIFEWDILMSESTFEARLAQFGALDMSQFKSIRVQDPGATHFIFNKTSLSIGLIIENGNHNLTGIKKWEEYLGDRLERVVLSLELPKTKIEEYAKKISSPIEFLACGPILLFYTPRELLSAVHDKEEQLWARGESEESPHKGFPILENKHGTFMFHIKDHYILDRLESIEAGSIKYFRVDLRQHKDQALLPEISEAIIQMKNLDLKERYQRDYIRGFFHVNKSDVLFKKLKNHRLQQRSDNYLGPVIGVEKEKNLVIDLKSSMPLKVGDSIDFITPEGKRKSHKIFRLSNFMGESKESLSKDQLAVIEYVSGIVPMSVAYRSDDNKL